MSKEADDAAGGPLRGDAGHVDGWSGSTAAAYQRAFYVAPNGQILGAALGDG